MVKFNIINAQGHLLGRLASICAKKLLEGDNVIIVKCEKIEISGKYIKNKIDFKNRRKKRTVTNPKRGPFHFKYPSQIVWKVIRGMLPHKTRKGTDALMKLKVYDGIPTRFNMVKKFSIPDALKIFRLSSCRKYCKLGNISEERGWNHKNVIERNNDSNTLISKNFYTKKMKIIKKKSKL